MDFVAFVALLALIEYVIISILTGRARGQYGVKAPATTGHPIFERWYRVQQNTVEQLVIFLPALFLFASYVSPRWGGVLGPGVHRRPRDLRAQLRRRSRIALARLRPDRHPQHPAAARRAARRRVLRRSHQPRAHGGHTGYRVRLRGASVVFLSALDADGVGADLRLFGRAGRRRSCGRGRRRRGTRAAP